MDKSVSQAGFWSVAGAMVALLASAALLVLARSGPQIATTLNRESFEKGFLPLVPLIEEG